MELEETNGTSSLSDNAITTAGKLGKGIYNAGMISQPPASWCGPLACFLD